MKSDHFKPLVIPIKYRSAVYFAGVKLRVFLVNGEANKLPIFVWRIENWDKDWFYYIRLHLQILGEFFLAIIYRPLKYTKIIPRKKSALRYEYWSRSMLTSFFLNYQTNKKNNYGK